MRQTLMQKRARPNSPTMVGAVPIEWLKEKLPIGFASQTTWLVNNGMDVACRMFDLLGWRDGWIRIAEVGKALFPEHGYSAQMYYVRAVLGYLVLEGEITKHPQVLFRRGKVRFDVEVRS